MHWIVTTDMDGTLLNHEDYRWQAAKPYLNLLSEYNIPVILNTSKTFFEVREWVSELGLDYPFIVENGSAIYCPKDYFPDSVLNDCGYHVLLDNEYLVIELGQKLSDLIRFKNEHNPDIETLVECTLERAVELTGLTAKEAKASQQRNYTLPMTLTQKHQINLFGQLAESNGMQILSGGRFAHLMGNCDKGKAIQIFQNLYDKANLVKTSIIALGDSSNDTAMLLAADHAIVIRNHKNQWLNLTRDHYQTTHQAPEGWGEGIKQVLSNDYNKIKELT